jgi:DNA-binding winged helix-turn-helix (wHTH) protein/tetratricopeptide (TPR) repeat protein
MATPTTSTPRTGVVEFEDCILDVSARELRRVGTPVALQPKAFDVLVHLLEARDRVVSKDELLDTLWPGEAVSESSLTFSIRAIRRAVGDDGNAQRVLKTVHGRGYRFIAVVHEGGLRNVARGNGVSTLASPPVPPPPPARDRVLLHSPAAGFVGRVDELQQLQSERSRAATGETRTVFVLGDPGVGKTRLVAELAAAAEADGDAVLLGRCYEGSPPAFWPWVQVVRAYLQQYGREAARRAAGPGLADIGRLVPGLLLHPDEEAQAQRSLSESEAEHARLRLFDSIIAFLGEAARERPVVIVLDDLHWADASSLLLLRHLVRVVADSRLLVLGTYRHMEVPAGGPLAELIGWMQRTRKSVRVRLQGLVDEDVAALVREIAGTDPSARLVAALGRATDGNPFFVEEYCRDLADRGLFAAGSDPELALERIPEEVRDVLLQRVGRQDEDVREVLCAASVVGREFRCQDLLPNVASGESAAYDALARAEESGLIRSKPEKPGTFVFAHALVSEVLYQGMTTLRRAQLHRGVGLALEAREGGDPLLRAAGLAHHFSQAAALGDGARALRYELEAGDLNFERFAYDDAAAHYERALELARGGATDARGVFEVLVSLSRAGNRSGRHARAHQAINEAVALARESGSASDFARAALRMPPVFPVTPRERIDVLEEAIVGLRAEAARDPHLFASLLAALAHNLYGEGDAVERREQLVDEALGIARSLDDRRTLLRVLSASQVALWNPRYLSRRLALSAEHVALVADSADPVERAIARNWVVPALMESADVAEADRQVDLFERDAVESRIPVYMGNALSYRAMRALLAGAFEDVEFLARRAYELVRTYNETSASMTLWSQLYYLRREQGRLAEIEPGLQLFAQQVPEVSWDWLLLHLYSEDERLDEARPLLTRMAATDFREGLPPESHIVAYVALIAITEVIWRLRDREAAAKILARVEPYRHQWILIGLGGVCLGSVAYSLGLLYATLGRTEEAIAALEEAEVEHARNGVLLPLLRTRTELGSFLIGTRDSVSRRRGRRLLEETGAEARRLGLVQLLRVIESADG